MSVPTPPETRPWRVIAAEIAQEKDSEKMLELVRELDQALEEQGMVKMPRAIKERESA
jgi:hypothetical protein